MLVQHVNRGGQDVLKVYLDRAQPKQGACSPGYCSACPGGNAPARWCLAVAGITAGGCPDCNNLNASKWMLYAISDCWWTVPQQIGVLCGFTGHAFTLAYIPSLDAWNISLPFTFTHTTPIWALPGSAFNCQAPNTLAIQGAGTACNNWPATLTVTPC